MVLDPIPQSLPVHFFGSRPQPPTSQSGATECGGRVGWWVWWWSEMIGRDSIITLYHLPHPQSSRPMIYLTLSSHFIITLHHHTLSHSFKLYPLHCKHSITPLCHPTLSPHSIITLNHHTLSPHSITPLYHPTLHPQSSTLQTLSHHTPSHSTITLYHLRHTLLSQFIVNVAGGYHLMCKNIIYIYTYIYIYMYIYSGKEGTQICIYSTQICIYMHINAHLRFKRSIFIFLLRSFFLFCFFFVIHLHLAGAIIRGKEGT